MAHKGQSHPHSEETKRKIGHGNKGKRRSEEVKQRISETKKRYYAEGKTVAWNKGTTGLMPKRWREASPSWKGGRLKLRNGYVYVLKRGHPNAVKDGYIFEHRLVMSDFLGRPLKENERVHHKSGIRDDNRLENLLLVLWGIHNGKVNCPYCNGEFAIR